jgi:hypothetical protein
MTKNNPPTWWNKTVTEWNDLYEDFERARIKNENFVRQCELVREVLRSRCHRDPR